MRADTDAQIAKTLKIELPTVRTHLARLYRRLGVNSRLETVLHVVTFAVEGKLY